MNAGSINRASVRRLAVWALCAAPLVLAFSRSGQSPSPQVQPGQVGEFDRTRAKGDAERERERLGPVTEEEWKEAEEFLSLHAPIRYKVIQDHRLERREPLKRFLVNKWRSISQLKKQSPELYNTRVHEVELDDQIYGLCVKLKEYHGDKDAQAQLNTKISELFNLGLSERHQRIGLVEKSLATQKNSLENDEHNKAQLIQQEYETVLAHGVEGARFNDTPRRAKPKPSEGSTTSPGEKE